MIILITASLSSKTYNKASWREDWTLEGTESIFSIGLLSEPWQPSRSQPPSRLFRSSETFSVIDMDPSAIWICLLPLLLFLCHTLPHIVRFVLLLLKRFLHNLQFVFSTRLLSACRLRLLFNLDSVLFRFLGNLQFLFCCHVSMTFSTLVSRHRSNFSHRDLVLFVRLGLQLALLFVFFWFLPAAGCALLPAVGYALLPAVGYALLPAVPLSEILVDLLLVVVHVLRLCAPSRQSGVTSLVDFSTSLALLAVMLSLFSVFWRRILQLYLVIVYCSEVRLMHLQRHCSACATSWSLVRGGCSGSYHCSLQQRGLLCVRRLVSLSHLGSRTVSTPHLARIFIAASDSGQQ